MKKSLLIMILALTSFVNAQRTVAEGFENAKPFLEKSECNSTGIAWIEGVLKLDPNNVEAKTIIKRCSSKKVSEAKDLLNNDIRSQRGRNLLTEVITSDADFDTEENNYLLAKSYLEDAMFYQVINHITKCINLNVNNNEYHWIRARASLTSNADDKAFVTAIDDLNFIIANNGATARVYNALGVAETELGSSIFRFKRAKENTGISDDNSSYIKEQTAYYNEAILHYENAKNAFKKSAEIKPETAGDIKYKIQDSDRNIAKIKEEIKALK